MKKSKYNLLQFKTDRTQLIAIVGQKLSYTGCAPGTFRVTFGDDIARIYLDTYLSTHTIIIRSDNRPPRYLRNQSWQQITDLFNNIHKHIHENRTHRR